MSYFIHTQGGYNFKASPSRNQGLLIDSFFLKRLQGYMGTKLSTINTSPTLRVLGASNTRVGGDLSLS
jgi:hypothetical protein